MSSSMGNSVLHKLLVQAHQVSDQINSACEKTGMSLAMARTLQFIASSEDSVTPSELSEGLGRSPAATSSLIKRLISDESVEVLVDPDDRRSFRISLTKVGMKKWRNIEPVLIDVESKISGGYGVNRLKSLAADLGDLKATVEASVG